METIVKRLMENHRLDEMAMERVDAIEVCMSLGNRFVEHFDEIYKENDKVVVSHWCDEMNAWLKEINNIVLKHNKKSLTATQKIDWFFTAGSSTDVLFKDSDEEDKYNEFILAVLNTNDVKKAFMIINLVSDDIFVNRKDRKSKKKR